MDDKLKVFWNLDVLVKMCRSKSDGPSLRIEEEELVEKIDAYQLEIEDIKAISEDESYDMSAEMADRNIEIITKKQLQSLKIALKEKNKELNALKEEEKNVNSGNNLLKDNKTSQEKYIISMQERINEVTDYEVIDRYNSLIAETTEKIAYLVADLEEQDAAYKTIQSSIVKLSEEIADIEEKIEEKKKLLAETQANLESKTIYIDKSKKDKNDKKINELENRVQKLTKRLDEIRKDPKYLESKIKDVINQKEDIENARTYLVDLINTAISIPYINVATDNALEEELLKATQARDTFANEIEQKSYNILEAATPEKIRIEFLNERIVLWNKELEELKAKVDVIDRDREYNYEKKNRELHELLQTMKKDLREFEKAYDDVPDINVGAKASVKAALDEKRIDIVEAEKIVTAFRKDESEDIARATRTIKYECDRLNQSIKNAQEEIETIKNRLTSKKSGLIDISTKNKDKEKLKELAQIVIDIKHRRQFAETPLDVIKRLEEELAVDLLKDIDNKLIEKSSSIVKKDYEDLDTASAPKEIKRGLKVVDETDVELAVVDEEDEASAEAKVQAAEAELQSLIENIESNENQQIEASQIIEEASNEEDIDIDELLNSIPEEEPTNTSDEIVSEEVVESETSNVEEDIDVDGLMDSITSEESTTEKVAAEPVEEPIEETPIEEVNQVVEEPTVEENKQETEEPVEEVVAEPIAIIEETPTELNITSVEEPTVEESAPAVEEPTVEESAPAVEETKVEESAPAVEESAEEEKQPELSDENAIDQQIDDIINNAKSTDENDQPLDIDAIFESATSQEQIPTTEKKANNGNDLAIDSIFNVESDKIDSDETTSETNLTDDFNQYIDDLENKETQ